MAMLEILRNLSCAKLENFGKAWAWHENWEWFTRKIGWNRKIKIGFVTISSPKSEEK